MTSSHPNGNDLTIISGTNMASGPSTPVTYVCTHSFNMSANRHYEFEFEAFSKYTDIVTVKVVNVFMDV